MRSTLLSVDLGAIEGNYRRIRAALRPGVRVMAVVKDDAYGHGAVPVARRLEQAGAEMFAVALLEEALELREAGVRGPVLVLGGICPEDAGEAVRANVDVAVYDARALEALERAAQAQGALARAHLKVDTGMARVGVRGARELTRLLQAWKSCPHVRMEGVFSHFAVADTDPRFTSEQDQRFIEAVQAVRAAGFSPLVHDSATSAIGCRDLQHDVVRPGIGLYGYLMPQIPGLRMAQRLTARPVHFSQIEPGDTVSYGRIFCAQRPTRVMTVPIGYGDGYPRILGNRAQLLVCGRRAPIVGRVCMDMLMADVTDIPEANLDSEIVLLGAQGAECIDAQELADMCDTIPYEIMLGFSPRVRRAWEG